MSETLTPQEVALRVRPYISKRHIGDIALQIDDTRIHLRNGYWNIPIRPSRWPEPCFRITKRWPKSKTRFKNKKA